IDAFEKEWPLFLKEDWEALVGGDDGRVGLNLSEIRIDREVKGRVCVQCVLRRQSQIEFDRFVDHAARVIRNEIEMRQQFASFGNSDAGNQLQRSFRRDSFKACDVTRLIQKAVNVARNRHPRILLAVESLDDAKDLNTPELSFAGFITQRLERYRHFNDVTVFSQRPLRLHDDIDAEIDVHAFCANAVHLYPERIEGKHIRFSLVVECVEQHANAIFYSVQDIVALGNRRAHFVRLVETMKRDVKSLRIVPNHGLGRLRRGNVIAGTGLIEVFKNGRRLPNIIIQP